VGLMFWMHWKLALLALATLPPLLFWTAKFARKVQHASRKVRQREAAMAATAAETVGAIQLIQALSLEGFFNRLFCQRNIELQKQDVKTSRLIAALGRPVVVLVATSTALAMGYGGWLFLDGELTPGELLVFLTYLRAAAKPMQELSKYTGKIAKATGPGERVLDLLNRTPEVCDLPGAVPAPPLRGSVRFDG